jgi:hypothetical protein
MIWLDPHAELDSTSVGVTPTVAGLVLEEQAESMGC